MIINSFTKNKADYCRCCIVFLHCLRLAVIRVSQSDTVYYQWWTDGSNTQVCRRGRWRCGQGKGSVIIRVAKVWTEKKWIIPSEVAWKSEKWCQWGVTCVIVKMWNAINIQQQSNLRFVRCKGDIDLLECFDPLGSQGVADFFESLLGTHCGVHHTSRNGECRDISVSIFFIGADQCSVKLKQKRWGKEE